MSSLSLRAFSLLALVTSLALCPVQGWAQSALPAAAPPGETKVSPSAPQKAVVTPPGTGGSAATTVTGGTTGIAAPSEVVLSLGQQVDMPNAVKVTEQKKGTPIAARFTDVVEAGKSKGLADVRITGTLTAASGVNIAGGDGTLSKSQLRRFRGRITWNSVSLDADKAGGTQRREYLDSPLISDFGVDNTTVPTGTRVKARGDVGGAVAAAMRLFDKGDTTVVADEVDGEKKPEAEPSSTGNSARRATAAASTPGKSNGLAASWSPSDPTIEQVSEDTPVVGTTTAGCDPRVDLANNQVVVQSQVVTDGVPDGNCTDTAQAYSLQKTYSGCEDAVDQAAKTAHPQYKRYWIDAGGGTKYADTECVPDEEQTFALTEDTSACLVDTNMTTLKASDKSRLVYTDRNNMTVVVADCRVASGAQTYDIAETSCDNRHDFAAGMSYQQTKFTYEKGGVTYSAASCADTGTTYAHEKVTNVCNSITDWDTLKQFPQYRTKITTESGSEYIDSGCQPDQDASVDLAKTGEGCETTFFHDLAGGKSYGAARYYHELTGSPVYVSECVQDTDTVYTHQVETTSYNHYDDVRVSKPVTRIFYTAPVVGEVEVSGPQERADAPSIAYVFDRQATVQTGVNSYVGCNAYRETALSDVYTRADNTEYADVIGPGDPVGPVDVCVTTISGSRTVTTGSETQVTKWTGGAWDNPLCYERNTYYRVDQTVNRMETKNMEEGVVVSTTCGFPDNDGDGDLEDDWYGWPIQSGMSGISSNSGGCAEQEGTRVKSQTQSVFVGASAITHGQTVCPDGL